MFGNLSDDLFIVLVTFLILEIAILFFGMRSMRSPAKLFLTILWMFVVFLCSFLISVGLCVGWIGV
jgi:bacteriorhodopsin